MWTWSYTLGFTLVSCMGSGLEYFWTSRTASEKQGGESGRGVRCQSGERLFLSADHLPRKRTMSTIIMVKKHLFQYGDNQLHNLQLKTARHLQRGHRRARVFFLFFDVAYKTSCRLKGNLLKYYAKFPVIIFPDYSVLAFCLPVCAC